MSERLIIRLASQPYQPISWLVYNDSDQEVMASGVLNNSDELTQITGQAVNRTVDVLVPGEDVSYFEVELPKTNRRQAIKAVPYMLEDELASAVEDLHFVYPKAQGDNQGVYVCEQGKMSTWLAQLAQAQISPKHLLADYLALPLPSDNAISIMQFEQNVLTRAGLNKGHSFHQSWLSIIESKLMAQDALVLEHYGIDAEFVNGSLQWQEQSPLLMPLQQLALGTKKPMINMLSGMFTQSSTKQENHWRIWRTAAVAAAVTLCIFFVDMYMQATLLEQQRLVIKAQSEAIYRQLNPAVKRVRMIKRQMTQQLKQYGDQGQSGTMLAMLVQLNSALQKVPEFKPLTIKYDERRKELRLQADAKNYQQFEQFKQLLSQKYSVTAGALNNDGSKVNGSMTIKATS
mgnify:CR=1 FL=1